MKNKSLRMLALDLLDDEHGVNSSAWDRLRDMLYFNGDQDIIDSVKATEGRYYLEPSAAIALQEV